MRSFLARLVSPFSKTTGLARWMLVVGTAVTGFIVLIAILAPWLAPYGFAQYKDDDGNRFEKLAAPSSEHLFGTTDLSTDVLSRVIWGAVTALEVVTLSVLFSVIIGLFLGVVSGYFGGVLDRWLVLIMDALFAFPSFLLAVVFAFLFTDIIGEGIWFIKGGVVAAALSLTCIYIPQYFRVVRNTTVSAKQDTYIEAARGLGASNGWIMRKYLFGNVVQSVPVVATLNMADALVTLAGLSFLGLGIQATEAGDWGFDLQRALDDAKSGIWWTSLYPGLSIVILITAVTLVGEGLNETVNPTLRKRRLMPVDMPTRDSVDEERP
jgi:peptide/nickel transport system permease protein